MKALVYVNKKKLEYKEVQDPQLKKNEALIKIESVGICGSDMHAFLGHDDRRPAPLILGHEAAGVIVKGKNTGKRVTVNPLVSCGQCLSCKNWSRKGVFSHVYGFYTNEPSCKCFLCKYKVMKLLFT